VARARAAVVVPTLNEEEALRRTLPPALAAADEVVVADGGSRDSTVAVARALGARVVVGPAGRGAQLNQGAAATGAELLLFLHADTTLPTDGVDAARAAIAGGAVGGAFRLRFDLERPAYRLAARLVNLRARLTAAPLGDQAQFASREAFASLGGFQPWPVLEDLDFARRLKRHGRVVILPQAVTTSARRFAAHGLVRTVARNYCIWALYLAGAEPRWLARLYRPHA
jgi:rSAM/selenodomain-associated transferase 2